MSALHPAVTAVVESRVAPLFRREQYEFPMNTVPDRMNFLNRNFKFKMVSLKLKEGAARTTAAEHRDLASQWFQCLHVVVLRRASKLAPAFPFF